MVGGTEPGSPLPTRPSEDLDVGADLLLPGSYLCSLGIHGRLLPL